MLRPFKGPPMMRCFRTVRGKNDLMVDLSLICIFELIDLLEATGYCRQAVAIEPVEGEIEPQYVDDRSYAFRAAS